MNIHLEYLTGTWLSCMAGIWGNDRAAHVAHEGGQSALFGTGAHERVGWIGRE